MVADIYRDLARQFRWRIRAANNKILAVSSESYVSKAGAQYSLSLIIGSTSIPVYDLTQE